MEKLTASTIQQAKALALDPNGTPTYWKKSKPVFLLTMASTNKLVVKGELQSDRLDWQVQKSVRWGSKLMKQVGPNMRVHELDLSERQALNGLADSKFANDPRGVLAKTYLESLLGSKLFVWFKMAFVEQLTDLETMVQRGDGHLALQAMRSVTVLKNLGKIVAVDVFLDNQDRFRSDGSLGMANSSAGGGNIFLQKLANEYNPVGLDFYLSNRETASNLCKPPPQKWFGLILADKQSSARYTFAVNVVASLNKYFTDVFTRSNTPYKPADLIDTFGVSGFVAGMVEGANTLREYLRSKRNFIVPGMEARAQLLGW